MNRKEEWYMGYWSDKDTKDAVKDALAAYQKKYGSPPSTVLVSPESDLKPMEGFQFVVQADPYVTMGNKQQTLNTNEICKCGKTPTLEHKEQRWKMQG